MDNDLALKIYIKARATPKVVAAFAERREFDKILIYSKQVKVFVFSLRDVQSYLIPIFRVLFCHKINPILVISSRIVIEVFLAIGWIHARLFIPFANNSPNRSSGMQIQTQKAC